MTRVFIALATLTVVFVAIGVIFFVVVWPNLFDDTNIIRHDGLTTVGGRVSEFQTLIGGFLAAFGALVTAISIYAASYLPIAEQEKKAATQAMEKRVIGALALYAAINTLHANIINVVEARDGLDQENWPEIDIPKPLEDMGLIASQRLNIGTLLVTLPGLIRSADQRFSLDDDFEDGMHLFRMLELIRELEILLKREGQMLTGESYDLAVQNLDEFHSGLSERNKKTKEQKV